MSERTEHGFRCGAILVEAGYEHPHGSGVHLKVGDAEVWVEATRAGRKGHVNVRNGKVTHLTQRWETPSGGRP